MRHDDAPQRLDRSAGTTAGETGEPEVVVLPTPEVAAQVAAGHIVAALTAAIDARGVADWATTGGSSPAGIYRALGSPALRDRVAWDRVRLWWGDDRFVRRTDPRSNVRPADELLLAPGSGLSIPLDGIHAMPMDDAIDRGLSPAWVAERYAAEVDRLVRAGPSGRAAFDIALVGIGGDGHLLSVFADSAVWDADATAIAVPAPTHIEPHVDRVTLHPAVLDEAGLLLAMAAGAGKAAILAELLGPVRDERRLPAQRARRAGATWLLDEAAASALRT
jgi:6-phosphogluconolactonase